MLGRGNPNVDRLVAVFQEVAQITYKEDGVVFNHQAITGAPIREDAVYAGIRLQIPGNLAGARFKLQVDVGMGDSVVPPPMQTEMLSLLDLPAARMRAYGKETVVAEKLEALVLLGLTTSRMKDLFDLDLLRRSFDLDDDLLVEAIRSAFDRRKTDIPMEIPVGLRQEFASDETKLTQWRAFLRKAGVDRSLDLEAVVEGLRDWLWPLLQRTGSLREP